MCWGHSFPSCCVLRVSVISEHHFICSWGVLGLLEEGALLTKPHHFLWWQFHLSPAGVCLIQNGLCQLAEPRLFGASHICRSHAHECPGRRPGDQGTLWSSGLPPLLLRPTCPGQRFRAVWPGCPDQGDSRDLTCERVPGHRCLSAPTGVHRKPPPSPAGPLLLGSLFRSLLPIT